MFNDASKRTLLYRGSFLAAFSLLLTGCNLTTMAGNTVATTPPKPKVIITPSVTDETLSNRTIQSIAEGANTPLYVTRCFTQSKLRAPYMVGQVIQTPAYALVTVGDSENQEKNAFCVVNKSTVEIELTPVNSLTYSKPNAVLP